MQDLGMAIIQPFRPTSLDGGVCRSSPGSLRAAVAQGKRALLRRQKTTTEESTHMTTPTSTTCLFAIVSSVAFGIGCPTQAPDESTTPSDEATFAEKLIGSYERVSPTPAPDGSTAYLLQTVTIEAGDSPTTFQQVLTTEAFFDEALTEQVLKYESVGPCEVVRPSSIQGGFEVDCTNDDSILTAYVVDPGLLQGLGIDDCNLTAGVPQDVSNGCAAPTFQVSACVDMDVFALSEDGDEFQWGDQSQDRCVRRTTDLEEAAFGRVD
jgi:hypothetical protein